MSFGKLNRKGGEDKVGLVSEGLGPKSWCHRKPLHAKKPKQAKQNYWAPPEVIITSRNFKEDTFLHSTVRPVNPQTFTWALLYSVIIHMLFEIFRIMFNAFWRCGNHLTGVYCKRRVSCCENQRKTPSPIWKQKALGKQRGAERVVFQNQWLLDGWTPACLWVRGRARMEHEKNGVARGERTRRRRRSRRGKREKKKKQEMVVDRRTWLRGRRWAAGCRPTARALPPRGPGPGSQPAAAP